MLTPDNDKNDGSPVLIAGLGIGGCAILVSVCLAAVIAIAVLTLLGPAIGNTFTSTVPRL